MNSSTAITGITSLPQEAYERFRGQWIALTLDGSVILAGDEDLGRLEERLVAAGFAVDRVSFDRVENEDVFLGGVELL